jgi:hypothetical protein
MNRMNRTVLAVAVAGALGCGIGVVRAGWPVDAPAVRGLDYKYPHMHNALDRLGEARHELEQSEDIFQGHKDEALGHVDDAVSEIKQGIREQHDESAISTELPTARRLDGDDYPHLHHALDHLREARDELKSADAIFGGHRDRAIEHTTKAIRQVEDALHIEDK